MVSIKNWQDSLTELKLQRIEVPNFDVHKLKELGKKHPVWIHFGGGNLYRGLHAEVAQRLANKGELTSGVVVCGTSNNESVDQVYQPYNNDFLQVVMHEDGTLDKRLIAVTADSFYCKPQNKASFSQVAHYFEDPALQFTTFTITEKGYDLKDPSGNFLPVVAEDIQNGPDKAQHTMSIVVSLLYKRFLAGELPIAMVSTDNFAQNGKRFRDSILTIAKEWQNKKFMPETFVAYLENEGKVSFPWSMVDRITPNPSESVQKILKEDSFTDTDIIHTQKRTNIAPFSNTEVVHYLVIEDQFPNDRPALEKAGVILTDRETVDKVDTMKVTTCLNPLHTALAVTGCLLGYTSISAEMQDEDLVSLIKEIGYHEGLPVVENPGIIDPKQFIDEVIERRLPNPNIPDTPQRIASDTSKKIAIRFGETIKKYIAKDKDASQLTFIPFAIAAWLRYLLAVDDNGESFQPSPDPLLEHLQKQLSGIEFGVQDKQKIHETLMQILVNHTIFGSDLYKAGIGEKIEKAFIEMLRGTGAVRKTLHQYITEFGGK